MSYPKTWRFSFLLVAFLAASTGLAQQIDIAGGLGYPQTIVYNGKIITMDDASFGPNVGTIVQAMAIRDGKVLSIGSNGAVRALAGPQTQQIDLKGRTVMPSFIMTHEHPTDWQFTWPQPFRHVLPNDDVIVSRWLPNEPPKQQLAKFEPVLREALSKAKPGQWVRVVFNRGPEYEWVDEMGSVFNGSIKKEYLDTLAPNNPVIIKDGFIGLVGNQRAVDEFLKVHATANNDDVTRGRARPTDQEAARQAAQRGSIGRPTEPDVMMRGKLPTLANMLKAEMQLWTAWGITTFGSSPYAFSNLQALHLLDQRGEMPTRFAWGYTGPSWDLETLRVLAGTVGHGTDNLWLVGAWGENGSGCMTVKPRQGEEQECHFQPNSLGYEITSNIIKSGLRIATMHTGGDKDIDYMMDIIEQSSKEVGISLDEIRAKRHAFDHGGGAPRPDQIPRIKNLGMMASQNNTYLWKSGASQIAKRYGIEYTSWVVPRKSMTDAGVMTTWEIDRPLSYKVFFFITKGMNRFHDGDQQVYGAGEKTDRFTQLKAMTRWGGYYVLREKRLGTLEKGAYADFIVLDRDILTVPDAEIAQIKVLMTMVGGKPQHLVSSLARDVGMQPVGPSTWNDPIPDGWVPENWKW